MNTYTCPQCGWTSYNPYDANNSYCGNCHTFQDAPKSLQDALSRGAEPFWMQDIRIAEKSLQSRRASRARSAPEGTK